MIINRFAGVPGKYVFATSTCPQMTEVSDESKCLQWLNKERNEFENYRNDIESNYICPCTFTQAVNDANFEVTFDSFCATALFPRQGTTGQVTVKLQRFCMSDYSTAFN